MRQSSSPAERAADAASTVESKGQTCAGARTLRCAVVGVGRMGRHHARKFAKLPGARLVAVVDADAERRNVVADELKCASLADPSDLLNLPGGVDAVTIAVPTQHHLRCAAPLLDAGIACLIEKPLATDAAEARQLAEMARRSGAVLMVGHIERFNPAVVALQRAQAAEGGAAGAIVPRFIEVHRVSPMTFRSVDVSAVMDMMIHDLDVVLWLMNGREPSHIEASGVAVLTEHEDIANARLTFDMPQGKCVANITVSRLAFKTERKIRIIGENAYVSIDYAKKNGVLIRKTANKVQMDEIRESLRQGADLSSLDYSNLVAIENLQIEEADQLEMEVGSFLDAVRTGSRPPIDAEDGYAAVRTAQRIIEAIRRDWRPTRTPALV
ncbi:MAG: Gfo/Idh/MocA family oxidoreductase [Phycisphaerales bacterium]|nr:Gfo/Idh/MocA family oxidoreductase [Phycisphaerales bacterium]